jgi:hypothetical protein
MPSKTADRRPYVTVALVTSGALLAGSGLAMLSWPAAPLIAKGWSLLGVSGKGIGTVHQVAAVGFLGSAGMHIVDKRRVLARHLRSAAAPVVPAPAADGGPV